MTTLEPSTGSLPAFTQEQLDVANRTFNPLNREVPDEVLGDYLVDIYGRPLCEDTVRFSGALAIDAFTTIPISEEELTDTFSGTDADAVASALLDANVRTAIQISEAVSRVNGVPADHKLEAVCDVLAQEAYRGVVRKTGSTHHSHAFGAAAMAHSVFRTLGSEDMAVKPEFQSAVTSLLLLHDAGEETMRPGKHFNPERADSYHALLVKRVFQLMGNDYASDAADAMRYMTHLKERAWMPNYADYILIGSQSLLFCQVKPFDVQHNYKVEPKPVVTEAQITKRAKKHEQYDAALSFLEKNAMLHSANREDRDVIQRTFELLGRIQNGPQVDKMADRFYKTIYGQGR